MLLVIFPLELKAASICFCLFILSSEGFMRQFVEDVGHVLCERGGPW